MDDLVALLQKRIEQQIEQQREHEDYVLSSVDSFLGLVLIVKSKY